MTISRAPIARPDYSSAALAGLFAGGLSGIGAGWLSSSYLHTPNLLQISIHAASVGLSGAPSQIIAVLAASGAIALTFGISAFLLVASEKVDNTVHSDGGQIKGIGAAKQSVKKDASEVLFTVAGIPFTRDRIRRSVFALGSIGGGKTQSVWHLIKGMLKTNHKLLVIDGPKGDFSRCWAGDFVLIAPWNEGYSWDISTDCPTRGHALQLAEQIIPAGNSDPMWANAAQAVLVTVLCSLQIERGTSWGWADLTERLNYTPEQLKELAGRYYPPALQSLMDVESKTTGSILINLQAFMSPIFEIGLAWKNADAGKKFSFLQWWCDDNSKIQTVILQGSAEFQKVSNAYVSGILSMLAARTASASFPESKTRKNVVVFDEFAQFPRINMLEKFIEIGRSKGCSLVIGTQSLAQIRKIWGQDDMQSWMAMVGTKIFGRVSGADDVEMTVREIGEKEVFRRTETITSNGTSNGSASVGWQKERVPIAAQSVLECLGQDKEAGGCWILVKGFGADVIQTLIPFISMPEVRPYCLENKDFNQHIIIGTPITPAITVNDPIDGEFTEIAGTDAPQQVPAVHMDNDSDESSEHLLIMQTAEPLTGLDEFSDYSEGEHIEDGFNEIGQDAANSGIAEVASEVLNMDGHTVELALEFAELLDEDAGKQAGVVDVAAVVDAEMNTGKRKLFKKRNQAKHGKSIDGQEV